ncbi:MAG: peptide deformylase [Clostridiales Family XIII bacterium]|jgi:peptide deformylase|nr:peptide deformylase [Clostridiales Family XIII bacterium]
MALRTIITQEDDILRKKAKEVKSFGERTHVLLDDMWDTMRESDGVGLAAPQVGILRRAIIVDVSAREDGAAAKNAGAKDAAAKDAGTTDAAKSSGAPPDVNADGGALFELLNPVLVSSDGEERDKEGCLSVPGIYGYVSRASHVVVKGLDRHGNELTVEGDGLLARALCHELDHLEGVLFTDIADEIDDGSEEDEGSDGE